MEQRFPYEQSSWSNDVQEKRRWYGALERMSPADVRALLAQSKAGSRGSVAIGSELNITRGFVEEWLAWQRSAKDESRRKFPRHHDTYRPMGGNSSDCDCRYSGGEFPANSVAKPVGGLAT
jgi:hypothetical protein